MKNKLIIAAITVVIILVGVFSWFFKGRNPTSAPASDVNFSQIGNLAFNNPGLNPDTWYLIFEKPGMPALGALLKFDAQSVCLGGPCPGNIAVGERVKVEGVATTSIVLVRDISTDLSQGNNESISLFYYNPLNDLFPGTRNIQCSAAGLVAVSRIIPKTNTPIQDAINLLLKGVISPDERARGITTDFPLPGLKLTGASLNEGVLTLSFDDPQNSTSGGSCRAAIIWAQIEGTAKQFPGVNRVKFKPDTLFQP